MKLRRLARFRLATPPCVCGAELEERVLAWEVIRYRPDPPTRRLREVRCHACGAWITVRAKDYQLAREVVDAHPAEAHG